MKRFFTFFFLTIAIYPVFTAISYGEVSLVHVVLPQTTPIAVGERLNVDIQIADAQGVVGYELTVGFDPTVSAILEAGMQITCQRSFTLTPIVLNNTVYIGATSVIGAASANGGKLATLTFEVVAARESTLELRNVILSDSAGMPLPVTTRDGRIETIQFLQSRMLTETEVNILDLTLVASNLTVRSPTTPRWMTMKTELLIF